MSICIYDNDNDNDNDNDIANTCIICSVIFELQNVKMVLKMALNFLIIVADTYTLLFVTVFITFVRYDKFLWCVQFILFLYKSFLIKKI